MIGCALCEDWFHIGCLRLAPCVKHLPAPGGPAIVCLVEPHGHHLNVSGEYVCPACSHTTWGTGTSLANMPRAAAEAPAEEAGAEGGVGSTQPASGPLPGLPGGGDFFEQGLGLGLRKAY